MTEFAPVYAPDTRVGTCHAWHCRDCGREMWVVTNGDAWVNGKAVLPGNKDLPVKVQCPHCGAWNSWNNHNN